MSVKLRKSLLFFPPLFILLAILLAACQPASSPTSAKTAGAAPQAATGTAVVSSTAFALTSSAFADGGDIPREYGQVSFRGKMADGNTFLCTNFAESANLSPPLDWVNVPAGTASLALTMHDALNYAHPNLPPGTIFPHWVIFNLPPDIGGLAEGISAGIKPGNASLLVQGSNAYPSPYNLGYGGPCPGPEKHLYVFTLYALDLKLDLPAGAELKALLQAAQGHILGQAELRGYYKGK